MRLKWVTFLLFGYIVLIKGVTSFAAVSPCLQCHKNIGTEKVVHKALEKGCEFCHKPHDKDKPVRVMVAEEPDLCFKCHDKADYTKKSVHPPVASGLCSPCHNPHGSDNEKLLTSPVPDLCYICHDGTMFRKKVTHNPVSTGMCTFCHNPHSSDSDSGRMLNYEVPELCFNCHDQRLYEQNKKTNHPPVQAGMCVFCHNPHATDNLFRLEKPINEMCMTCHTDENITSGRHVIMGLPGQGNVGHPLKGRPDPKRKGREMACSACHNPHGSNSVRMFRYKASAPFEVCNHCHNK